MQTFGDLNDCRIDDILRAHHPLRQHPPPVDNKLSSPRLNPRLQGWKRASNAPRDEGNVSKRTFNNCYSVLQIVSEWRLDRLPMESTYIDQVATRLRFKALWRPFCDEPNLVCIHQIGELLCLFIWTETCLHD